MKNLIDKAIFFNLYIIASCLTCWTSFAQAPNCDVTWRKADNPRIISGTQTIAANQNVCAEPGVVVQFASDGKLNLFGRLIAIGTEKERITFTGANVFPYLHP